jgi:hypothetical protein
MLLLLLLCAPNPMILWFCTGMQLQPRGPIETYCLFPARTPIEPSLTPKSFFFNSIDDGGMPQEMNGNGTLPLRYCRQ